MTKEVQALLQQLDQLTDEERQELLDYLLNSLEADEPLVVEDGLSRTDP